MFETISVIFLILLVGAIFYGYSIVMRKPPSKEELNSAQCTLCRKRFPKETLVEREIGDYKVLYFCNSCISGLSTEASKLNNANH
ncbi:MAG: hypothetical protein HY276_04695 [Ignavibacteriales bacterium]|nr:hypothetical protein [Ignavibacteriales bacterium]MBI3787538.1 hypothetical protein [Ignavibacteriales bacterium]